MIANARGPIDYDETGAGPTIVLVPGSCSTGAAWRPIISHLQSGFRCVTTSLLGYGGTAERRSRDNASIAAEADIVAAVIRHRSAAHFMISTHPKQMAELIAHHII